MGSIDCHSNMTAVYRLHTKLIGVYRIFVTDFSSSMPIFRLVYITDVMSL